MEMSNQLGFFGFVMMVQLLRAMNAQHNAACALCQPFLCRLPLRRKMP
jgi:hypothetical protein